MKLTYDEIKDILDVKNIAGSSKGYTPMKGIFEVADNNMLLKSLLLKI